MPDTGAPYFIPYVVPTDLVSDWPDISEDVALAIAAALDGVKVNKKIAAFTASGTWTVPAGVTYAIAHMRGGGAGGIGRLSAGTPGAGADGGASSVGFAAGTVSAAGGERFEIGSATVFNATYTTGTTAPANSGAPGSGATLDGNAINQENVAVAHDQTCWGVEIVAGGDVTPGASITVTVGAGGAGGGAAGQEGGDGGSGYVYIEYYE